MPNPKIDPTTLELIERLDAYRTGLEEDIPDAESLFALEEAASALLVKLERLADQRDPAGNASNQPDGLTPLEVCEALVQTMPVEIQQSGGDPIVVRETKIDFDPDCEAATDAPTRFWMRVDSGETFSVYVRRTAYHLDDYELPTIGESPYGL